MRLRGYIFLKIHLFLALKNSNAFDGQLNLLYLHDLCAEIAYTQRWSIVCKVSRQFQCKWVLPIADSKSEIN